MPALVRAHCDMWAAAILASAEAALEGTLRHAGFEFLASIFVLLRQSISHMNDMMRDSVV